MKTMDEYEREIGFFPLELQTSTAVLFAIVRCVSNSGTPNVAIDAETRSRQNDYCHHYINGTKLSQLPLVGSDATFSSLLQLSNESVLTDDHAPVVEFCDIINMRLTKVKNQSDCSNGSGFQELLDFHREALLRSHISKMLSHSALPMRPELTLQERSVKETELLSISSLSACDLYRADQLRIFEQLLRSCTVPVPNYTGTVIRSSGEDSSVLKRRYFRNIPPFTFPQILSYDTMREASMIKRYYPMTDQLLVALHWPAAERRTKRDTWTPDLSLQTKNYFQPPKPLPPSVLIEATSPEVGLVKSVLPSRRSSNAKGLSLSPSPSPSPTAVVAVPLPVTEEAKECDDVPIEEQITRHNLTITPAGNAIVMVKQTSHNLATWLSIHTDDNILGLRYGSLVPQPIKSKEAIAAAAAEEEEKEIERERERRAAIELQNKNDPGSAGKKKGTKDKKGLKVSKEEKEVVLDYVIKKEEASSEAAIESGKAKEEKEKEEEKNSGMSTQDLDLRDAYFFCDTDDDVRVVSFLGTSSEPSRKPDKHGTVCLSCSYLCGLQVLLCSNGSVKYTASTRNQNNNRNRSQNNSSSGGSNTDRGSGSETSQSIDGDNDEERYRVMCVAGTVVRHLTSALFRKEVYGPDGSRTFFRRTYVPADTPLRGIEGDRTSLGVDGKERKEEKTFLSRVLSQAPYNWQYIRLTPSGHVLFFNNSPDVSPEPKPDKMMRMDSTDSTVSSREVTGQSSNGEASGVRVLNTKTDYIDAETFAEVSSYQDGRLIVRYRDGLREVHFPDGTRITTHQDGNMVFISKEGLPPVEVDTEHDRVSSAHSKGVKAPLAKGGDKIRVRVALPDGSAAMIKYDTRITCSVNGSIKMVRRDRTVLLVKDSGLVSYSPRTAWDDEAALALIADSRDVPHTVITSPVKVMSTAPTVSFGNNSAITMLGGVESYPLNATDQAVGRLSGDAPPASPTFLDSPSCNGLTSYAANEFAYGEGSLGESSCAIEDEPSSTSLASLNDPLLPLRPTRTKIIMDLSSFSCHVEDHEHNVFDIFLRNPLCPKINLSGEVDGLKPTAVSVSPCEPRLFVMDRSADVIEILSTVEAGQLERVVVICPDASKTVTAVASQPVDLAAGKQHTYRIRQRTNRIGDVFSFEEVFAARPWQRRQPPAAVSTLLYKKRRETDPDTLSTSSPHTHAHVHVPKTHVIMSLIERMPLSHEGYRQLSKDLSTWEQFQRDRERTMDSFVVADSRAVSELEVEERVRKSISAAYKIARALKAKQNAINPTGVPSDLAIRGTTDKLLEGEGDDLSDDSSIEGEVAYVDEVEGEIRAAFESYAVIPDRHEGSYTEYLDGTIPHTSIRSACIQVLNCHVAQSTVDKALLQDGYVDMENSSVNLDEFREILGIVKAMTEIDLIGISATPGDNSGLNFTSDLGSPSSFGSDQQWEGDREGDDAAENRDMEMGMDKYTPAPPMQIRNHRSKVLPLLLSVDKSEAPSGREREKNREKGGQGKATIDPRNTRIPETDGRNEKNEKNERNEKGSKHVMLSQEKAAEKSSEKDIKGESQSSLYPAGSAVQFARNKH